MFLSTYYMLTAIAFQMVFSTEYPEVERILFLVGLRLCKDNRHEFNSFAIILDRICYHLANFLTQSSFHTVFLSFLNAPSRPTWVDRSFLLHKTVLKTVSLVSTSLTNRGVSQSVSAIQTCCLLGKGDLMQLD